MAVFQGASSGNLAEVDANNRIKVNLDTGANPSQVGGIRIFSENDPGSISGTAYLVSPETDDDYRLRVAQEVLLDCETFNYTAQNTGKHFSRTTTWTAGWTTGGLSSNTLGGVASGSGFSFGTYAEFPILGSSILYCEIEASISATPNTNTVMDFGLIRTNSTVPYAPTDGVMFRLTSDGISGVINHNTSETSTGTLPFTYTVNKKYQFIIAMHEREVEFWIDNVLYGTIETPVAQGQPCMSSTLPFAFRHAIVGGNATSATTFVLNDYSISVGGSNITTTAGSLGNRLFGSYQGLSGGTMGTLANYANSTNPSAAVPTNTTAALGSGLGGQFWETATLAVNTDGVISSYQVPAGTTSVQGKRLVIRGVGLTSYIQTVIAGGPYVAQYSLAFGHTSVSLATGEAVAAKAPRRIALSSLTQVVTAAQAVSTMVSQPGGSFQDFGDAPIYVNPGEFVQLVTKHVGTVGSSGTIAHVVTFTYGWE
jgi:hypothetical protein